MFHIGRDELVIGGKLWVLYFDPNVTSLDKIGLPKQFEYAGRYSPNDGSPTHIRLYNPETNKQFRIDVDDGYSSMNTGHFIVTPNRIDLFHRISGLRKSNSSPTIKYMATKYVEFLKQEHPEYVL
jgi:hypothetical protein